MKPIVKTFNRHAIVYDADRIPDSDPSWLTAEFWRQRGAIRGTAAGRGSVLFIDTPAGPAVLRQYLRGGWPARLTRDRYLFTGRENSRPFREFHLLARLHGDGLPVPAPLAASCVRIGLTCRGALLMERILHAEPLGVRIAEGRIDSDSFARVGACVRTFHHAGLSHADLNVDNILLHNSDPAVYLVDFDRCRYTPGKTVPGDANLRRLHRSLRKCWSQDDRAGLSAAWQALVDGYRSHG